MIIGVNTYFPHISATELLVAQKTDDIPHKLFDTPEEALEEILGSNPDIDIIAIGEYLHPKKGYPKVPSPKKRFQAMKSKLKGRITDLVMETWIIDGKCKEVEKKVVQDFETNIDRPASNEDETIEILILARDLQIKAHILKLTCKDYKFLLTPKGKVDYGKVMLLIKRLTEEKVNGLYTSGKDVNIGIYGGRFHITLYPKKENKEYSYGPALSELSRGKYLEVELVVPEYIDKYIDNNPELMEELSNEGWFKIFKKHRSRTKTLLINPKPNSYMLVFPRAT